LSFAHCHLLIVICSLSFAHCHLLSVVMLFNVRQNVIFTSIA
jgi:hypothetical protein